MLGQTTDVAAAFDRVDEPPVTGLVVVVGSTGAGETSGRSSGNWAIPLSSFSERAPYNARLIVSSIACNLLFSSRNSTIIPIRISGSRGREATSATMPIVYQSCG